MIRAFSVKAIFCLVCSAGLHFFLLQQVNVGQATLPRPDTGNSGLNLHYISTYADFPAIQAIQSKPQPKDISASRTFPPFRLGSSNLIIKSDATRPIHESLVVENFYETPDVDEPAAPEGEWPIVVDGITQGTTFNVQLAIWISSLGRIERVDVIQMQPESEKVRLSLQSMRGAMVRPALQSGVNVANKRNLELWITQ